MKAMKIIANIISVIMLLGVVASCGVDNFDEPNATLYGKVVYKNEALNIRGTGEAVQLQLFQDGYDKREAVNVHIGQDGTFSAKLFNGEYKLVSKDGNGPWVNSRDTVIVNVKGSTEINFEVTPYFIISGENITVSGSTMNAAFSINQIVAEAKINKVMLILSKTQFADNVNNVFFHEVADVNTGLVNLSADISGNPEVANAKSLFARVGVLSDKADQAIYSQVVRIR